MRPWTWKQVRCFFYSLELPSRLFCPDTPPVLSLPDHVGFQREADSRAEHCDQR